MFNDIGGKIKGLATFICWVGIIGSFFGGLGVMVADEDFVGLGILIIMGGCLGFWIGSFFMYGFGQLIQNTDVLVKQGKKHPNNDTGLSDFDAFKEVASEFDTDSDTTEPDNSKEESVNSDDCHIGVCDVCAKEFILVKNCTVKDSFGTWQRDMCNDCISQADIAKTIVKVNEEAKSE